MRIEEILKNLELKPGRYVRDYGYQHQRADWYGVVRLIETTPDADPPVSGPPGDHEKIKVLTKHGLTDREAAIALAVYKVMDHRHTRDLFAMSEYGEEIFHNPAYVSGSSITLVRDEVEKEEEESK